MIEMFELKIGLNVRTNLGWSKRRVESMDSETRESFLRRVRLRLEKLSAIDFVDDAIVIFATAVAV